MGRLRKIKICDANSTDREIQHAEPNSKDHASQSVAVTRFGES